MTQTIEPAYIHKDYQEDFAQRLVKTVGYEDAIRECYENQWLGTLKQVQKLSHLYNA
jgi:hypothetical protein